MGVELSLQAVLDTLLDLRTYRRGLIQTEQQLKFSVDAILQGLRDLDLVPANGYVVGGKRLMEAEAEAEDACHEAASQSQAKKRKNSTS